MTSPDYAAYQLALYRAGEATRSGLPFTYEDLDRAARTHLPPEAYGYVAGGAGDRSMAANLAAFDRIALIPRVLRDLSARDLTVTLFGQTLPAPLLLAPIGVQGIIHPEGEVATARGAAGGGVPIILSTLSSVPLETVAQAMGPVPRWFQLYRPRHPDLTRSFLDRAKAAGFTAVVLTVDTKMLGWRPRDLRNAYLPFLAGQGLANYFADPVFRSLLARPPEEDPVAAIRLWSEVFSDPAQSWEDLAPLRAMTDLPILLKGVLHPDDARHAQAMGIDGLIVSNHGGRQLDGSIASLDALPAIVDAVGDFPVLLDSGIRTGSDAVKALALGARAVLLARPYVWGLALAGEAGVAEIVRRFLAELDLALVMTGQRSVRDLSTDLVTRALA